MTYSEQMLAKIVSLLTDIHTDLKALAKTAKETSMQEIKESKAKKRLAMQQLLESKIRAKTKAMIVESRKNGEK